MKPDKNVNPQWKPFYSSQYTATVFSIFSVSKTEKSIRKVSLSHKTCGGKSSKMHGSNLPPFSVEMLRCIQSLGVRQSQEAFKATWGDIPSWRSRCWTPGITTAGLTLCCCSEGELELWLAGAVTSQGHRQARSSHWLLRYEWGNLRVSAHEQKTCLFLF